MSKEIERKWIFPVKNIQITDLIQQADQQVNIQQGYLSIKHVRLSGKKLEIYDQTILLDDETASLIDVSDLYASELRYRLYNEQQAVLTFKSSGCLVRKETEFPVSLSVASSLSQYAYGKIKKTRFKFTEQGLCKEVDIYDSKMCLDFGVIEIEFSNITAAQNYVLKTGKVPVFEVTDYSAFKNKNLALNPNQAQSEFKKLFPFVCSKSRTLFPDMQHLK